MSGQRWQRVQQLFEGAADLSPAEQAVYLEAACGGDEALRREVDKLLRSDLEAGPFIEQAIRSGSQRLLAERPEPIEALGMIGKYEVLGRIGEGGFGLVYQGRDAVLQRFVALKTCTSIDRKLRRRFFREGQIAAGLQHPNITTVHDLGIEEGIPYLVQEFLDGEDLHLKIARHEPLTLLRRLDILAQVARGLDYAHGQGVLHRDIKPANIRVLPGGAVKIMDFGIAKLLHEVSDVTTQGVTLGTVGYLAPEQLRGESVDRRTDVFSFGVVAYEVLTGERPFKGSTFSEISYRLLNEEPRPMRELAPACGAAVTALIERCLAKNPQERCGGFDEVLAVLEPEVEALRSGSFVVAGAPAASSASPAVSAGPAAVGEAGAVRNAGGVASAAEVPSGAAGLQVGWAVAPRSRRFRLVRWRLALAAAGVATVLGGAAGWMAMRQGPPAGQHDGGFGGRELGATDALGRVKASLPTETAASVAAGRAAATLGAAAAGRVVSGPIVAGARSARSEGAQPAVTSSAGSRSAVAGNGSRPAASNSGHGSIHGEALELATLPFERPPAGPLHGAIAAAPSEPVASGAGEPAFGAGGLASSAASATAAPSAGPATSAEPATSARGAVPAPPSSGAAPAAGAPRSADAGNPPDSPGGTAVAESGGGPLRPMVRGDLIAPGLPATVLPRLLSRPDPLYPDRARRRKAEADVLLLVLVDESGHVIRTLVKKTDDSGLGFNEAARQAAMRASFTPATREGLPGKMWTELPFSFRYQG